MQLSPVTPSTSHAEGWLAGAAAGRLPQGRQAAGAHDAVEPLRLRGALPPHQGAGGQARPPRAPPRAGHGGRARGGRGGASVPPGAALRARGLGLWADGGGA